MNSEPSNIPLGDQAVNRFLDPWAGFYKGMKFAKRLPATCEFTHPEFGAVKVTVSDMGVLTMTTEGIRSTELAREAAEVVVKAALATADN